MSQRPPVDRDRIISFLKTLGNRFDKQARIYLVGGATIILENLRPKTIDIDLTLEVSSTYHQELIESIRKLKDEMQINVEEANPADFIPIPDGWKDRCVFFDKFGKIDVYHFDLYSVSLCKIERGLESDYNDVLALLNTDHINMKQLEEFFNSILPRYGKESIKQDPAKFKSNFSALRKLYCKQ